VRRFPFSSRCDAPAGAAAPHLSASGVECQPVPAE
jgi:hypothetical protein